LTTIEVIDEAVQSEIAEPLDGHGLVRLGRAGQAPPSFTRGCQTTSVPFADAALPEEVDDRAGELAVFQPNASELAPQPLVE
jgi:hypothetical protein